MAGVKEKRRGIPGKTKKSLENIHPHAREIKVARSVFVTFFPFRAKNRFAFILQSAGRAHPAG